MFPEHRIRQKVKQLRQQVAMLSSKRLVEHLDRGDRHLLVGLLDDLLRRVNYLHHLDKSRCSIVLEACGIHYGERAQKED